MENSRKIAVAITGASGAIYARTLLNKLVVLKDQLEEVSLVMSNNAREVWLHELGNSDYEIYPFRIFGQQDFNAPFASGSARYDTLVICPCSMGTLARIATGVSNDLITRAADVILKERRRLILVTRDTPLSLIHINNMRTVTEAGAIVCPASPSFYSQPNTLEELSSTVVDRVIDLIGLEQQSYRWGTQTPD
jgi:flavin prenyltransferase